MAGKKVLDMMENKNWALLAALCAFALALFISGCIGGTQPNSNLSKVPCCVFNSTVPSSCHPPDPPASQDNADCSNSDKNNTCYNFSNGATKFGEPIAAICPEMTRNPCSRSNCTVMAFVKDRRQAKPKVSQEDASGATADTTSREAGGLIGKYATFSPLNSRLLRQVKSGGGGYVNAFRLGIGGDFSDYDRGRYYFPISDYFGEPPDIRKSVVDRFTRYLGLSSPGAWSPESPPICIPLGANAQIGEELKNTDVNLGNAVKFGCFEKFKLKEEFKIADFKGNKDLARLACTVSCSPVAIKCDANTDLLVEGKIISPQDPNPANYANGVADLNKRYYLPYPNPSGQSQKAVYNRPFINLGEFDQENPAGKPGYTNALWEAYRNPTPISPYPEKGGVGPDGGMAYECSEPVDCLSGRCDKTIYHRTACLIQPDPNDPNKILPTPIDCQCKYIRAEGECELFYGDCTRFSKWHEDPRRDACEAGKKMCMAARHEEDGNSIVCYHNNSWDDPAGKDKANKENSFMALTDITNHHGWPTLAKLKYTKWDTNPDDAYHNTHFMPPAPHNQELEDFRYMRIAYSLEPMRMMTEPGSAGYSKCLINGNVDDNYGNEASCKLANGVWAEKMKQQWQDHDLPILKEGGKRGYKTAFLAVPQWQPVIEGTVDGAEFSPTAPYNGGAFIVVNPNYQDKPTGPGNKTALMETFPFMKACGMDEDSIEKLETNGDGYADYGFKDVASNRYVPRTIEIPFYDGPNGWGDKAPGGVWRIKDWGKCIRDENGWLKIVEYGMCNPKTYFTMAYQNVENFYWAPTRESPWTGQEFASPTGYCPTNCDQHQGWCECKKEYGLPLFSVFSKQAPHSNPELGYLTNTLFAYQSEDVLPVLNLRAYNFSDKLADAEKYYEVDDWSDPCLDDTSQPGELNGASGSGGGKYECSIPELDKDPLLSYLDAKHQSAILITDKIDTGTVFPEDNMRIYDKKPKEEILARVLELKRQCSKCTVALEIEDKMAVDHMFPDIMHAEVRDAITDLTDVNENDNPGAKKLKLKALGLDGAVLVLHLDLSADPANYEKNLNLTMNITRGVLAHTGWATLVFLHYPNDRDVANAEADAGLYRHMLNRSDEIAAAGIIGFMYPRLNSSKYERVLGDPSAYPEPMVVDKQEKFQDSPRFCAAQNGSTEYLSPRLISGVMKVRMSETCDPLPCNKQDLLAGNCGQKCMDGKEYNGYDSSSEASKFFKCPKYCFREANCAMCDAIGNLLCYNMTEENPVPDIKKPVVYPGAILGDADAMRIGSMSVPCCLKSGNESYTYSSQFSRTTSSDDIIYGRFNYVNTSCSDKISDYGLTQGCASPYLPPLESVIYMCEKQQ